MAPRERRQAAANRFVGCRSILFVPADRTDRCAKALASGADAVCIDLEDAVAPDQKDAGRVGLRALLAGRTDGARGADHDGGRDSKRPLRVVRINDPASAEGRLDAELLCELGRAGQGLAATRTADQAAASQTAAGKAQLDAVMIPKVRAPRGLQEAAAMLSSGAALLPLIETAQGLEHAAQIASANVGSDGAAAVGGLVLGGFDLSLELGAEPGWESLLYARSRVVHAAALAGVPAFDMPSRDVRGDMAALRQEADRARRLGFCGKAVVHPVQLAVVHDVFTPTDDDVASARRVVEADRKAAGGPVALDGKMVDRPIVEAARSVLARAGRTADDAGKARAERDVARP